MKNDDMLNEIYNVLQSTGKSRSVDDYPVLQIYLKDTGLFPFIKSFVDFPLNSDELIKRINKYNPEMVLCKEDIDYNKEKTDKKIVYALYKISKGYYLEVSSNLQILDGYDNNEFESGGASDVYVFVSYVTLLCPPSSSSLYNKNIETDIINIIKKHYLRKKEDSPSIGMICEENGEFYIKDFFIKQDYKLVEGDLHYGEGFMDFHKRLLKRFKDDTKGLVLFHGVPGTGKTYYIRTLLKELIKLNKFVIYLPPNMVDFIVSPSMLIYISQIVTSKQEEGKSCVLLIEDAETLILSRKIEKVSGITNLLNLTDGLLNDMLNIQVIATFNTDLKNIDNALLRPERLIARKEFKKLSKKDTEKLIQFLNIKKELNNKDYTLAEIYSEYKEKQILIHEYNPESEKIGFKTS